MFKEKLGDSKEVYIHNMVVKSEKAEDHLHDLEEDFRILDEYNMKLNPAKCHFGGESREITRVHGHEKRDWSQPETNQGSDQPQSPVISQRHSKTNRESSSAE